MLFKHRHELTKKEQRQFCLNSLIDIHRLYFYKAYIFLFFVVLAKTIVLIDTIYL